MDYDAIFEESLGIGLKGEELLRLIAKAYVARGEDAVEVKNDQKVSDTGNLYIEHQSRERISGIDASCVPYWAFILNGPEYKREVIIIIKTSRLQEICQRSGYGNIQGGDSNTSKGYLISVDKLVRPLEVPRLFPEPEKTNDTGAT